MDNVVTLLHERGVLWPSESSTLEPLRDRLDESQWQDVHLAAADIHLRRRLADREPLELPVQPSATETVMGLLTADTGIMCLGGLPPRHHLDRRFDVFLFTGDVIKSGTTLPTDPETLLNHLQQLAEQFSGGLAALHISDEERFRYQALQPLLWASRAVVYYGPESVGATTVHEAVDSLLERYPVGGTVAAGA
jgi:hypothetical protein